MRFDLVKITAVVALISVLGSAVGVAQQVGRLRAPTYYIAAKATYDGDPSELRVIGVSNLPTGARLSIHVYRFIGEGGSRMNEDATTVVNKEGFFEITLHPIKGNTFQHNLACEVVFMVRSEPPQPSSVLQIVGSHGENLGFPKNPQVGVMSGESFYLSELSHVP